MVPRWDRVFAELHAATAFVHARQQRGDALARLRRAREFIDASFDDAIDLERIATAAGLSRFHFLRLFKDAYGETPHAYLTRRRLERAKTLLLATDLPVTRICLDVGFSSLGSFSTLFSRHVGKSPDRYRRRFIAVPALPLPIPACFHAKFAIF